MTDTLDRLSLRLTSDAMEEVKVKAASKGISVNEFVRQALGTELFLLDQISDGARIMIERPDKPPAELVLR